MFKFSKEVYQVQRGIKQSRDLTKIHRQTFF
jgi:hypothetical protein